jgi:hypothetical protein
MKKGIIMPRPSPPLLTVLTIAFCLAGCTTWQRTTTEQQVEETITQLKSLSQVFLESEVAACTKITAAFPPYVQFMTVWAGRTTWEECLKVSRDKCRPIEPHWSWRTACFVLCGFTVMLATVVVPLTGAASPGQRYGQQPPCPTIIRHQAVLRAFQHAHPCPATGQTTGACPGWVKDHLWPLCAGGTDTVGNLVWSPAAEAALKDRWEKAMCRRLGCQHRGD